MWARETVIIFTISCLSYPSPHLSKSHVWAVLDMSASRKLLVRFPTNLTPPACEPLVFVDTDWRLYWSQSAHLLASGYRQVPSSWVQHFLRPVIMTSETNFVTEEFVESREHNKTDRESVHQTIIIIISAFTNPSSVDLHHVYYRMNCNLLWSSDFIPLYILYCSLDCWANTNVWTKLNLDGN